LIGKRCINNDLCPYVFIKRTGFRFVIIVVYVDHMNLIGTLEELRDTATYLKFEFEMKDLGILGFV
jgi:hypothetical protein